MKLKLFNKYFFTTALIVVFSLSIMAIILSFVLNNNIAKNKEQTLNTVCEEVADYIKTAADNSKTIEKQEFYQILNSISVVAKSDIFVADQSGELLICGCAEWNTQTGCPHKSFSVTQKDFELYSSNKRNIHIGDLGVYDNPHYISVQTVLNNKNEHYATIYATTPVSLVFSLMSAITKLFFLAALIPLLLMFLFIYAMTYRLTKPLKLMSEASRAMAKGDFSRRIPVTSDDEIGELATSFNMMTNSLSQLESMRKSFVANVSHELKTPMTTIGGFIDGILDGTIEPEKQSYYLGIVADEVKRLSRLVQSMLSMSKLESGEFVLKPELFDFSELLCSIVISQEQLIEKQDIEISGLDTLPNISLNADRDLIHQVIYNLVDNAVKFTNNGGKIDFSLQKEGKNLSFSITNSGSGIPQKDIPYIFDRFYKVDKSRSAAKNSTGLGLYIVKTIIAAHSGTISVASVENVSTTFKITLPTA